MSYYPFWIDYAYAMGMERQEPENPALLALPAPPAPEAPESLLNSAQQQDESTSSSAGAGISQSLLTDNMTPSTTDTSFRPGQPSGPVVPARQRNEDGPEIYIAYIRRICNDSQRHIQSLTQAIVRQPGVPGNLQDLLSNDLRNEAQQIATICYYVRQLEKKLEEGTKSTFEERGAHEAALTHYRRELREANDRIDHLIRQARENEEAFAKADKARKFELDKKTEKINNQKRRIKEQQDQISALKEKSGYGSKETQASRAVKFEPRVEEDKSPSPPPVHSAYHLEDMEPQIRTDTRPIPKPKYRSAISAEDQKYLMHNLEKKVDSETSGHENAAQYPGITRMERDNQFQYPNAPTPSYGNFGHQVPMMGPTGHVPSAVTAYGGYSTTGAYGGPPPSRYGRNLMASAPPASNYSYGPPSYQPSVPFQRHRTGPYARGSESSHHHSSAMVASRRDDDSGFDPETKVWKDLFEKLFSMVMGWSASYCKKLPPGAVEEATMHNPKLWEYCLKVATCHKDIQSTSRHALFMLNSPDHRPYFVARLILQYIEQEMLHYNFWLGWDDETSAVLKKLGPIFDNIGYPLEERREARQKVRAVIENIIKDDEYADFRKHKISEHANRFKDIAGPFLNPAKPMVDASVELHAIANIAMEISNKMLTSRLSFAFTWNECAVKYSHDSHIALNSGIHGVVLQQKHHRVMLVVTPSISYRDDSGVSIVPRGVRKAQVLIMS